MIDRPTQLQASGRFVDRQLDARARRLAAEASCPDGREFWLTEGTSANGGSGGSVLAGVRTVRVAPGPTLAPLRRSA